MNARNKLKTIDLMRIDTHIVYHAQRIIKKWGWNSVRTEGSLGSEGSSYTDSDSRVEVGSLLQTDGIWGSKGSCHLDSASRVGMGSL